MQVKSKEYENVLDVGKLRQEMAENKNTSNSIYKRKTEIRSLFKWVALTLIFTTFIILVTVPTALVTTGAIGIYHNIYHVLVKIKSIFNFITSSAGDESQNRIVTTKQYEFVLPVLFGCEILLTRISR